MNCFFHRPIWLTNHWVFVVTLSSFSIHVIYVCQYDASVCKYESNEESIIGLDEPCTFLVVMSKYGFMSDFVCLCRRVGYRFLFICLKAPTRSDGEINFSDNHCLDDCECAAAHLDQNWPRCALIFKVNDWGLKLTYVAVLQRRFFKDFMHFLDIIDSYLEAQDS